MFSENDREDEEPATVLVGTNSGEFYDIKNIPGHVRKRLVDTGRVSVDTFVHADNMPGYKLKNMRDTLKRNMGIPIPTKNVGSELDIEALEVGTLVKYKNSVTEVKKVNIDKGTVYIDVKGVKKGWVGINKLKAVHIPNENDE